LAAPSSASASRDRPAAASIVASAPGGAALALAVPLLFLHVDFQPVLTVGSLSVSLSDAAVLAVAALALALGLARGFSALAAPRAVWLASAAFLAYLFAASVYPLAWDSSSPAGSHLVTAAKFTEYALLAPAAVLLLRTRRDLLLFLAGIVAWSVVATLLGLLQYAGVDMLREWAPGGRQPSLLGVHEFASFSATTMVLGLAALAWPPPQRHVRRGAAVAAISGGLGLVLSRPLAGGISLGLAALGLVLLAWRRGTLGARRLAAGAAVVAIVAAGLATIRSGDLTHFARFVGVGKETPAEQARVQTYSQRTLMTYFGYRMWRARPLLGAGWSGSTEPRNFEPYTADAERRFPEQPPQAFPTRAHPWPIDSAYVQALAELGILGAIVFVTFLATAFIQGARASLRAPPAAALPAVLGTALLLVAIGVWSGQGISAGTPHDAVVWLGVGLIAAGRARA
jgi:O-antigen ligase